MHGCSPDKFKIFNLNIKFLSTDTCVCLVVMGPYSPDIHNDSRFTVCA